MLIYFKVGNYKSIKDPIVVNFMATAIAEHNESNVHRIAKDNLLKTILLYGPNASGKSKVIDAIGFFRNFILGSAGDAHSIRTINVEPFLLNDRTRLEPSSFEAEFIISNKRYRYGFETTAEAIKKEWLLEVKATTEQEIFLRIGQQFEINSKKFVHAQGLEVRTRSNALFLSVSDQWNVPLAHDIINWFDSIYTIDGLKEKAFKVNTTKMLKSSQYNSYINELIQTADLGINALEVVDLPSVFDNFRELSSSYDFEQQTDAKHLNRINALHEVQNDQGNFVDMERFSMEDMESQGTQKFYNLTGVLLEAILEGRLVIIDEFDARLHTLLSRSIIQLFNNARIKSSGQLLAACHDTALLDRDLLRRDQICFLEKNQSGATTLTNLAEYKVRKESPYSKNYLEGKYGAIPFIKNLENSFSDGQEEV